MSTGKSRPGSQGKSRAAAQVPARDPNVEEAHLVGQGEPFTPPPPPEPDAPMPTIENSVQYRFMPGRTCSILDVNEIGIAYILMLQNNDFSFEKGALRHLSLPQHAFDKLSDEAQKFLVPLATTDAPAGA